MLAAGFFDGLHRGHWKVIDETIANARKCKGQAWVLTFDTHPIKILEPKSAPQLLTSTRHKLRLLGRVDPDGCLLMPFTRKLANLDPEAFISMLCACVPALAEIFVGQNWRFGHEGKGDTVILSKLAKERNVKVTMVRSVLRKGKIISSTRIRNEITCGKLKEAATMLGRPFSILGTVTRGRTVGRKLGFPTANLNSHNEVLPPFGVYAVYALLEGGVFNGVLNMGTCPTFKKKNKGNPSVELYLLDLNSNLYGKDIEVFFIKKLREERRFLSKEHLKTQILLDVKNAFHLLVQKKIKNTLYIPNQLVI